LLVGIGLHQFRPSIASATAARLRERAATPERLACYATPKFHRLPATRAVRVGHVCDSGEIINPILNVAEVFARTRYGRHELLDLSATQQLDRFSFRELPRIARIKTGRHKDSALRVLGYDQSIKLAHIHHRDLIPCAQVLALDETNLAVPPHREILSAICAETRTDFNFKPFPPENLSCEQLEIFPIEVFQA
jgi:hypothetical protein